LTRAAAIAQSSGAAMLPSRQKKAAHQQLAAKSDFSRKSDGLCFPSHCPNGDRLNVLINASNGASYEHDEA
jgi:hypothetical protein